MKTIEHNLKEICRSKGLTLTDVANRIGTSTSNLLSSVKGNPTITKLRDIADAVQVNVSELLNEQPGKALGIAIFDGIPYQITRPLNDVVQLPYYAKYDILRHDIKEFVKSCINKEKTSSKIGMVETMEVFSLVYDSECAKFYLSLCYANGKTITSIYDKLEYCNWPENESDDNATWNTENVTEAILDDIEGEVILKLKFD